jgi:2-polyprenyl-6-methoxyphenol hydroxylase-like FAD-dependent oxidoreductase
MDRNWLNERLLTEAEQLKNVEVVFQHKLLTCDVLNSKLTFLYKGKEKTVSADIIVGADGVYSQVRTGLMRAVKCSPTKLMLIQNGLFPELYRLYVVRTRNTLCDH